MTALSDDFPVLLAPVRVETRFTATELLVRVFPDEWAVDKFETKPTDAEISALDAYWVARWAAGGRAVPLQTAWRELAGRVPAGRASWLLRTRKPANPTDEPAGVRDGAVVLVVRGTTPPAAADRQPSVTYWSAVWRAHGDREAVRLADVALNNAVKTDRANAIRARRPSGVDGAAVSAIDDVVVAFLVLPVLAAGTTTPDSWTRAAQAQLLPDRFRVLGFAGGAQVVSVTGAAVPATLEVSPNPHAADQISVNEQTGVLHVPDNLRWLTDFDRAVTVGMGVRIPLTDPIRGGLDRLVVIGLREQSTPAKTATDLALLVTRQLQSSDGFSLLPQGTPTNNSEAAPAGVDADQEADATLRTATASAFAAAADWTSRTDGRQLAELLGLDPAVLTGMPNADGTDQRDARAANTALWPSTWGYFLQTAMNPLLGPGAVAATRDFFLKYVSGRGPLPAVKIGRQPYGILPTTAFSRLAYPQSATHRRALQQVLNAAGQDWAAATAHVPRLDPDTDDAHQLLLDILALHPTSAEFHQRYAHSVEDLFNRENLGGLGATVLPALSALNQPQPVRALLGRFGAAPGQDPAQLRRLFVDSQQPFLAPLVDDRPLSETDPIRPYTTDKKKNYIRWLADLAGADPAQTDFDAVRLELGFDGDARPPALLYLLLRHAVLLGWDDAARALAAAAGIPVPSPSDAPFVHLQGDAAASESRFRLLYSPAPAITGDPARLLVDFIPTVLAQPGPTAALAEQAKALDVLADLPTARLERVLAEHLDLATYRLDAWRLGLATERLSELRFGPDGTAPARTGLHLGAYGWLEDVRPSTVPLTPVTLTGPLATVFAGTKPLLHDPRNEGFVHTPSPGHARTAAVLRAGYAANRTPDNHGAFAVNLSAARVRVALSILDGLRQGQSLGALLGYRFERGLHDRHAEAEVDEFIAALRVQFPLRAGKIEQTALEADREDVKITQVEARNVVDGLALVRYLTRNEVSQTYPFDLRGLPDADPDQTKAITDEAVLLVDANDAVADLAVAESAHQALAGNVERAAATLDAYAKDGLPPEPSVIETPRSGITLTHRFGLRLKTGQSPAGRRAPRAKAEPAVDDWLPSLLPSPDDVAAVVTWTDDEGHAQQSVVTQDDLGLAPIDLLWTVRPVGDAAMTDLDDRIIGAAIDDKEPRPDAELTIQYTRRVPGKVGFFELSPLITALRTLLTTARPLRPSDLVPAAGPTTPDRSIDDGVTVSRRRPDEVHDALDDLADDVDDYVDDLARLYPPAPAPPRRGDVLDRIDAFLTRYADLVGVSAGFGMVRSGWSELTAWRRGVYREVLAAVAVIGDRLARALADADVLLAAYDKLPRATPDAERLRLLRQIERLLTTTPDPTPQPQPGDLLSDLRHARNLFAGRVNDLRDLARTNQKTLGGLLDEVAHQQPLTDIDATGLDLSAVQDRVVGFGAELLARARALLAEVQDRLAKGTRALAGVGAPGTTPADNAQAAIDALRAMIGPDVLVVPEYPISDDLAHDLDDAYDDREDLVKHLTQAPFQRDFPVDDWLHGVARVRDVPRLWERVVLLSDALRGDDGLLSGDPEEEPGIVPIQLPFREDDHWLGMEFAPGADLVEDRVLFTAHYADEPSSGDDTECGLLFDEWTEVIPTDRETTGLAVHADSPDSEPPQSMLLVVPPVRTGTWDIADLIAAVTETFDLARTRLVEPAHLDGTGYAQLLPATVLSATRQPITISTDLAIANVRWKATHD